MNQLLSLIEPLMFWGGLFIYLLSVIMFGRRTRDWNAVLRFWQPMIAFTATEFKVNRAGMGLMILAVIIRIYLNFFAI
jgi:hypothetical protein